jgi:hypothetical protein
LFFDWLKRNNVGIITFLAGLSLLAGLLYSDWLGDTLRYLPDEAEYVTLANLLAEKGIYSLDGERQTAYRPPVYPAVLSLVSSLGGDIFLYRYLNFVFLGGCIYLTGWILIQQGFPLAGVFGSLLVIAYPVLFYTAGTLYPQTLAAFLFLIILKIYTQANIRPLHHLIGGGLFGLLVLTVPTFFYTFFIIGIWLWIYRRPQLVRYAIISTAAMILVIGSWAARNYHVFGAIFFVSTNSGENLLIGNSANTIPNGGTTVDISAYLPGVAGMNEVERDHFFRSQAVEYIISHPQESARLYLQKVLNYFNYRNDLVTEGEQSTGRDLLMLVTYGFLLAVFLVRLLMLVIIKASPLEVLFITLYLSSALITAIFFTRIRFRLPFDYLLMMIVGIMFERIYHLRFSDSSENHQGFV